MSLLAYPEYKESGVEWLGEVPKHWGLIRLRFVGAFNPSKSELNYLDDEEHISFLPMESIGDDGSLDLQITRPLSEVRNGYTYFRNGDVTVAKITPCFENGKGALMRNLINGVGFGTTELIVIRPQRDRTIGSYLNWLFRSPIFRRLGEASMYGAGGQKRVPDDFIRNLHWALPPINEQAAIAAFLDRETGKIDALIAEQEKLLDLLAEKRQATISHAVTRGLNPNAPMKDSGIAWLGEVPEHWASKPIKRVITFQRGHDLPLEERIDGPFPIVSSAGISGKHNIPITEGATIVTGRYGTIGEFHLISDPCWPLNTSLYSICMHGNCPKYLFYMLESIKQLFVLHSLKTAVPGVDRNDIHPLGIYIPKIHEQEAIVFHLDYVIRKIIILRENVIQAIICLKERRSALIAAAVTGKIDVRGAISKDNAA
ncbi:restriction endonuclease subunit S [Asaia platycodi]|uniref:restriction endonuclease subunit S n=1 Tax=Asaia platycodi TaxID=610243 RepID=UPI00054F0CB9|nr:restriction endonuclease subunit S [Asaia platycodi]